MNRIGLLGGTTWESSLHCHRLVNEATRDRIGQEHSPVPVCDTTRPHALHAVDIALSSHNETVLS